VEGELGDRLDGDVPELGLEEGGHLFEGDFRDVLPRAPHTDPLHERADLDRAPDVAGEEGVGDDDRDEPRGTEDAGGLLEGPRPALLPRNPDEDDLVHVPVPEGDVRLRAVEQGDPRLVDLERPLGPDEVHLTDGDLEELGQEPAEVDLAQVPRRDDHHGPAADLRVGEVLRQEVKGAGHRRLVGREVVEVREADDGDRVDEAPLEGLPPLRGEPIHASAGAALPGGLRGRDEALRLQALEDRVQVVEPDVEALVPEGPVDPVPVRRALLDRGEDGRLEGAVGHLLRPRDIDEGAGK